MKKIAFNQRTFYKKIHFGPKNGRKIGSEKKVKSLLRKL